MKKVLSLVLAVMLVVGMAPTVFAKDYAGTDISLNLSGNLVGSIGDVSKLTKDLGDEIKPGHEERVYIVSDAGTPLLKQDIKDSSIDVKYRASKGSKAIDKAEIAYDSDKGGAAYINLKFVGNLLSTGDVEFDVEVYLTKKKSQIKDVNYSYEGKLSNESEDIDDGYDYFYLGGDIKQVNAKSYIKEIELDLGNGVSIFAKLFNDKKYYGRVTTALKDEDIDVVNQYPDIDEVYYLETIGLNSTGNYVKLDVDGFVYNSDLQYIGKASDKLPYSTKYYISSVELDVEDADEEAPADGAAEGTNPEMGGDDVPENVNDNPGTGC